MSLLGENKETLEEMAATVAHEIKNPLALALANLDIIKVCDIDGKFIKNCGIIEKELYKINELVLDMIHSVREDEREERFDLSIMLKELIEEYASAYETINFSYRRSNDHQFGDLNFNNGLQFFGQQKKIKMIFTNLLNNAVEAIKNNGRIELIEEVSLYDIRIIINDNGVGLNDDMYNESPYYTTKENGTGVGLRYCRNTTAACGGRFILQNRTEEGCQAIVELPLAHSPH